VREVWAEVVWSNQTGTRFRLVWSDQWAEGQNSLLRINLNAIIGNKSLGNTENKIKIVLNSEKYK
jgi:hypothetical protein